MSVEYSVPFNITDEPIIAAAHKNAFVIWMVVDFIPISPRWVNDLSVG